MSFENFCRDTVVQSKRKHSYPSNRGKKACGRIIYTLRTKMGFFSKNDAVVDPPNKTKRKICWDSRDVFFDCLTKNKIENSLDPLKNQLVETTCGGERQDFENKCVASWYKYFQEKRYNDIKRQKYISQLEAEGAKPLPFKLDRK